MPGRPAHAPPLALAALLAWGLAPDSLAPGRAGRARDAIRSDARNAADTERMERGYYEALGQPARVAPDFGPLTLPVPDVREYVLKPGVATSHRGARWSTNARGMRDRDHPLDKPANTYRVAMAGDSIGAGWGVGDGRGFEPAWERALDARSRASGGPAVEVLNFAVPGHAPGQRWEHLGRSAWAHRPDLVVFQGTPADLGWDDRKLRSLLPRGVGWDSPSYHDSLILAGARPGGDGDSYRRALRPHRGAILAGVYRAVAEGCRSRGVPCAWVLLPRVGRPGPPSDRAALVALARSAGFSIVVDLSDAFDGLDPASLAIAPDDFHPNALGHARLADRIDIELREFLDAHLHQLAPGGDRR